MVTLSSSTEQQTPKFVLQGSEPKGSGQSPPGGSDLLQRQHRMRAMIAERWPKADLCSVSFSIDQGFQMLSLQLGASIVCITSLAESGYKSLVSDNHRNTWEQKGTLKRLRQASLTQTECPTIPHHIEVSEAFRHSLTVRHARKTRHRFSLKVGNASVKRLLSGAFAGAVSRTAVAPLETIRTHLMVGSGGGNVGDVFQHIMHNEGWQGLFRGNGVNIIRVAPNRAIELFSYDTIKKVLDQTPWVASNIPIPSSSIAGATAGVCSTLCTYPLELLKTRLTIQRGVYKNLMDAFMKICQEEGPRELYRGLTPSLIGVIPYAATNYFAYDFLRRLYRKLAKQEQVGNLPTLLIGSAAGAFASASTFPLEVARKQMQVGALTGRPVYNNLFHALSSLLEQQGPMGLYRGLGASCFKLIPAAGISFMCYEACKRVLIEEDGR